MPQQKRYSATAAAVCLAIGGTAILTWAFSFFSEDKSKKSDKSSEPYPNYKDVKTKAKTEVEAKDVAKGPLADARGKIQGYIPIEYSWQHGFVPKCDFIEYFYKSPEDNKISSKPNEQAGNEAAQLRNSVAGEHVLRAQHEEQLNLQSIVKDNDNLNENTLHSDYNSAISKSGLLNAIQHFSLPLSKNWQAEASTNEQSIMGYSIKQLDTKVNIIEDKPPVVEEIIADDFVKIMQTPSVSYKELLTKVRIPPDRTEQSTKGISNNNWAEKTDSLIPDVQKLENGNYSIEKPSLLEEMIIDGFAKITEATNVSYKEFFTKVRTPTSSVAVDTSINHLDEHAPLVIPLDVNSSSVEDYSVTSSISDHGVTLTPTKRLTSSETPTQTGVQLSQGSVAEEQEMFRLQREKRYQQANDEQNGVIQVHEEEYIFDEIASQLAASNQDGKRPDNNNKRRQQHAGKPVEEDTLVVEVKPGSANRNLMKERYGAVEVYEEEFAEDGVPQRLADVCQSGMQTGESIIRVKARDVQPQKGTDAEKIPDGPTAVETQKQTSACRISKEKLAAKTKDGITGVKTQEVKTQEETTALRTQDLLKEARNRNMGVEVEGNAAVAKTQDAIEVKSYDETTGLKIENFHTGILTVKTSDETAVGELQKTPAVETQEETAIVITQEETVVGECQKTSEVKAQDENLADRSLDGTSVAKTQEETFVGKSQETSVVKTQKGTSVVKTQDGTSAVKTQNETTAVKTVEGITQDGNAEGKVGNKVPAVETQSGILTVDSPDETTGVNADAYTAGLKTQDGTIHKQTPYGLTEVALGVKAGPESVTVDKPQLDNSATASKENGVPNSVSIENSGVDNSVAQLDVIEAKPIHLEKQGTHIEDYSSHASLPSAGLVQTPKLFLSPLDTVDARTKKRIPKVISLTAPPAKADDESPYISMLGVGTNVSAGYFINLSVTTSETSQDSPSKDNLLNDLKDKAQQITELYINLNNNDPLKNDLKKSELHSTIPLQKELMYTKSSPVWHSEVVRSEMCIKIVPKVRKTSKGEVKRADDINNDDSVDSTQFEKLPSPVSEEPNEENVPSSSEIEKFVDPLQEIFSEDIISEHNLQASTPYKQDSAKSSLSSIEFTRTEETETEEIMETSVEETVTMIITGVILNPEDPFEKQSILSMQEAVDGRILDLKNGLFYNPLLKQTISLPEAMSKGHIKFGKHKVEVSQEAVKSVGRITIRTTRETMPYTVTAAKNTSNSRTLGLKEAKSLNIINLDKGTYRDLQRNRTLIIGDAVDLGLVEVDYNMEAEGTTQEETVKTYSVHAVVDQLAREKIPFHEAVRRGLIDSKTGGYISNLTQERFTAEEAIKKGFIKATLAEDPENITVDRMGNKFSDKVVKVIRKKVLKPLKMLKSMKH